MHLFVDWESYFRTLLRLFYLLTGTYFQQLQIMDAPDQCMVKCCRRTLNEEIPSKLSKCSFWNTDVSFDRDLFYDEAQIDCTEVLRQKSMYLSIVIWCCHPATCSQSKALVLFFLSKGSGKTFRWADMRIFNRVHSWTSPAPFEVYGSFTIESNEANNWVCLKISP